MPEHEAAPSPAGMLGRMDAGSSGLRTIFLLQQASLRDICCFFSLSGFPEEAVLAFIASPGAWHAAGGSGGAEGMGMFAGDLIPHCRGIQSPGSSTACPPQMLMRFL